MMGTVFRYKSVLLPEYYTTIVISFLTTLIAVSNPKTLVPTDGNPHYPIATAICGAFVLVLIGLTLRARWRWCTIEVNDKTIRGRFFGTTRFEFWLSDVVSIREDVMKFYGRRARRLTVRSTRHDAIEIADHVYQYERLKQLLSELPGCTIEHLAITPEERERLQVRAAKRDHVFGRPQPWRVLLLLPVRAVGLLPVLVVDLFFTFFFIYMFNGDASVRDPGAVYAGPVSLVAAAFTARFVYHRLVSSIRLNRVVRLRWQGGTART